MHDERSGARPVVVTPGDYLRVRPADALHNIFRGLAYAARYGKADPVAILGGAPWSRRRLHRYNKAVESLLREEKDAYESHMNNND